MAILSHPISKTICISLWLLLLCLFFLIPLVKHYAPAYSFAGKFPPATRNGTVDSSVSNSKGSIVSYSQINNARPTESLHVTEDEADLEMRKYPFFRAMKTADNKSDPCSGRYIYIHDLPRKFNEAILEDCENLDKWMNLCEYLVNNGFGPELNNGHGVLSDKGWYHTNQFTLEVIFHHRMKHYDCLTRDSSLAAAIYVPFYAGFDINRYLFKKSLIKVRDALSHELVDWLTNTPKWKIMGGKDHILVAGRVTWSFRRLKENISDWGNNLLLLPEIRNMSTLLIESSPKDYNDFAIPYPTYFHPTTDADVLSWQDRNQNLKRKWLFSFAGAPRPKQSKSIRNIIIDQCNNSEVCKLLGCVGNDTNCHSPEVLIRLFQSSQFCLQPRGDSATRRSTFDAILAGCIPVFFHQYSAYNQYTWHLPRNNLTYSVFISEEELREKNVNIEERLRQISPERIEEMRKVVIDLIPKIVYADASAKSRTFKDAFDIAVDAMISRITKLRRDVIHEHTHKIPMGN